MGKLTQYQAESLTHLKQFGDILQRWQGGFWSYPGCPTHQLRLSNAPILHEKYQADSIPVPDWYIGTNTVKSLEKKGYLERTHKYQQEWKDDRRVIKWPE